MNTEEMTNKVQDWQKRATESVRNLGQTTDQYVRENTWATIGLAALVGCLLGYLLSTSRD